MSSLISLQLVGTGRLMSDDMMAAVVMLLRIPNVRRCDPSMPIAQSRVLYACKGHFGIIPAEPTATSSRSLAAIAHPSMGTNRRTSDVLSEIAGHVNRHVVSLNGKIERGLSESTSGGNGLIYRGTRLADGMAVAVKTARGVPDLETVKKMLKEAHTWSKLKHPNVHSILGITTDFDHTVSLVSLWLDGGSAYQYVQKPYRDPRPLVSWKV